MGAFEDVSVNATGSGINPDETLEVKLATGVTGVAVTLTYVSCADILEPPAFDAVKLIDQFPTPSTVVFGVPDPNEIHVLLPVTFFAPQSHDVGTFVEVSVNNTGNGAIPRVVFVVNDATGATAETVIYEDMFDQLLPYAFVARSPTEYVPELR